MQAKERNGNREHPFIKVRNFGPITTGNVELRPLTVFTGPSNTGKSWLATLIYALHVDGHYPKAFSRHMRLSEIEDKALPNFPENPETWLECLRRDEPIKLTEDEKQTVTTVLEYNKKRLVEEILRCFGLSDHEDLVREGTSADHAMIEFELNGRKIASDLRSTPYISTLTVGKETKYSVDIPDSIPISGESYYEIQFFLDQIQKFLEDEIDTKSVKRTQNAQREIRLLAMETIELLFSLVFAPWYLPADRGGIMHAHQTVVGALIQNAAHAGLSRQSAVPELSGVLADFLTNLVSLSRNSSIRKIGMHPRRDRESNHAENLQRKVLGGRVDIERTDINYPSFSWKPDGWSRSLSLLNVSSMVSELIPVALYLNHMVDRGDLLILEEPEAHLHPARQVDLIREVAAWVRGGVRVLLTTHSEWVLEALSNLVGEGEVDDSAGLRKDQVGLWHFDPPKSKRGGSKIREVPWNEDEGGFVTGYEDVAADLHNRWADLVGGNE